MRIKEITSIKGNYFAIYLDDVKIKTIRVTRLKKERNGRIYFFLFDSDGKVIDEVYKFINFHCIDEPINGREQMINTLKILYSYKEMINKELKEFDMANISGLSNLILGIGIEKDDSMQISNLGRGGNTHNIYFNNIRKFYKYLKIENEYLFEQNIAKITKNGNNILNNTKEITAEMYKTNKAVRKKRDFVIPKYISSTKYVEIIKYIHSLDKSVLRNSIIVNLMFTTGMRLGEVLGLTLEDIKENVNNPLYGTIYIRNRVSDKKYQKAKTCLEVSSIYDYKTKQYQTENDGYQIIDIAPKLFELIKEYSEKSRNIIDISETVMINTIDYSKADAVEESTEDNQYIFLNKNGLPLSSSGWNKFIKAVFKAVGIRIDKGVKKNNLSHRFRHGYAMYLINEEHRSIEYVKDKLRHVSLQSTLVYYNPTEEENLRDTKQVEDTMREKLRENN